MDSYIVAYDICDPKRLRKVATTCEDFGYRKQYLGVSLPPVALPTLCACGAGCTISST